MRSEDERLAWFYLLRLDQVQSRGGQEKEVVQKQGRVGLGLGLLEIGDTETRVGSQRPLIIIPDIVKRAEAGMANGGRRRGRAGGRQRRRAPAPLAAGGRFAAGSNSLKLDTGIM